MRVREREKKEDRDEGEKGSPKRPNARPHPILRNETCFSLMN